MRSELKRIHEEFKTTIVFVTHDQWEAMTLATSIAVMSDGALQQVGTPNDIYERPANRFVAEFVGSPPINIVEMGKDSTDPLAASARAYFARQFPRLADVGSIGMRPESLAIALEEEAIPKGAFFEKGKVSGVLPTGGSWIIEVHALGTKLFLTTHLPPAISDGDEGYFYIRPEALHVFDLEGVRHVAADTQLRGEVGNVASKAIRKVPA